MISCLYKNEAFLHMAFKIYDTEIAGVLIILLRSILSFVLFILTSC